MTLARKRVLPLVAAALGLAVTVSAGCWQWRRAEGKREAHEAMMAMRAQPPWHNADWPCREQDADATGLPVHKPVLLTGRWLTDKTVYLDNRPMDGMSGFIVVTPLRLSRGVSSSGCEGGIVLVERGWLPRDMRDRQHLPDLPALPPGAEVTVAGRVLDGLSRTYQLGSEPHPGAPAAPRSGPLLRQNTDQAFWAEWLGQAPLAGAVLQMQAEIPSAADPLRRNWPEPGSGQERHLAYAAQWFAMAALITGLTLWFQIFRPRRQASSHVSS